MKRRGFLRTLLGIAIAPAFLWRTRHSASTVPVALPPGEGLKCVGIELVDGHAGLCIGRYIFPKPITITTGQSAFITIETSVDGKTWERVQ